jgi:hypothetical protein
VLWPTELMTVTTVSLRTRLFKAPQVPTISES